MNRAVPFATSKIAKAQAGSHKKLIKCGADAVGTETNIATGKGGNGAGQARLDVFLIVIEHIDRVAIAKVKRVSTEQPREPKRSKE